ncbi:MAG: insulinase family protein [Rubellimicrobium sp.]|nr:insulinase family protein [Rubellimicrobium sp.]
MFMQRHILISALALVLPLAPVLAEEVTTATLDNGMEVVVIEDHRAPAVFHSVWYRTGAADEPPGASGAAHFLEHLMFKATDTLAAGELSAVVTENGGSDNAATTADFTYYYQRIAADRLDLVMGMEADRMRNLRLTPEDIETERQVVIEERNQRTENNPDALADEQGRAAQYLNHPYGAPVVGWMHELRGLGYPEVMDFYHLYYSPNNAILVVAGDVDPAAVIALAQEHYGPIPPAPDLPPRLRPEEPPQRAARHLLFADPRVAQDHLTRSYLAPERDPGDQGDAAALLFLAEILGGSPFTSVLARDLVHEQAVATEVWASYQAVSVDATTFRLGLTPAAGVPLDEAEAAMDAALARFLDEGVDLARFERLRTQLRAAEIYARDNVTGLALRYGAALASGLSVKDVQDWPAILQSVTEADVMRVARAVLDPDHSVTVQVVHESEEG